MIRVTLGGSVTGARWRIRNCRVSAFTVSLNLLPVRGRPKIDSTGLEGRGSLSSKVNEKKKADLSLVCIPELPWGLSFDPPHRRWHVDASADNVGRELQSSICQLPS